MKTTKRICKDNEVSWYDGYHTKWYSEEELKELIKQFKENIELSGSPDNDEDNSYYNAICDFEVALFGDEHDKRSMD